MVPIYNNDYTSIDDMINEALMNLVMRGAISEDEKEDVYSETTIGFLMINPGVDDIWKRMILDNISRLDALTETMLFIVPGYIKQDNTMSQYGLDYPIVINRQDGNGEEVFYFRSDEYRKAADVIKRELNLNFLSKTLLILADVKKESGKYVIKSRVLRELRPFVQNNTVYELFDNITRYIAIHGEDKIYNRSKRCVNRVLVGMHCIKMKNSIPQLAYRGVQVGAEILSDGVLGF